MIQRYVVVNRTREDYDILQHQGAMSAEVLLPHRPHVDIIHQDRTLLRM